jgi:hypothetical protein
MQMSANAANIAFQQHVRFKNSWKYIHLPRALATPPRQIVVFGKLCQT